LVFALWLRANTHLRPLRAFVQAAITATRLLQVKKQKIFSAFRRDSLSLAA
jgi:hypothetical protein